MPSLSSVSCLSSRNQPKRFMSVICLMLVSSPFAICEYQYEEIDSMIESICVSYDGTRFPCEESDGRNLVSSRRNKRSDRNQKECQDLNENCEFWASHGECRNNPNYMETNCPLSCETCESLFQEQSNAKTQKESESCQDLHDLCDYWASEGECLINPLFMRSACRRSCYLCMTNEDEARLSDNSSTAKTKRLVHMSMGVYQRIVDESTKKRIIQMDKYVKDYVSHSDYDLVRRYCQNNHADCAHWSTQGKCLTEPFMMMQNCPLACFSCKHMFQFRSCLDDHHYNYHDRSRSTSSIWNKSLHDTLSFSQIWEPYGPEIISSPSAKSPNDPWLIRLDSLLSEYETIQLQSLANSIGYQKSPPATNHDRDEHVIIHEDTEFEIPRRNSQSAFCKADHGYHTNDDLCEKNPILQTVMDRISKLMDVSSDHFEPIEFNKYSQLGDSHGRHHDYRVHDAWKRVGPRMFSVLIHLSGNSEESPLMGGAIGFPKLDWTTIPPKQGQAIIWSNVNMGEDGKSSLEKDLNIIYETLPVVKGELITAHFCIHLNNWKKAEEENCVL